MELIPPPGLHSKIATIQGQLSRVPKNGYNSYSNYKYATEDDVLSVVRPLCSQFGISMMTTCIASEVMQLPPKKQGEVGEQGALVTVRVTLTDSESGETCCCEMPGYSSDKMGKAIYQAITGATKYAILKMFCVSTGDDPEQSSGETTKVETPQPVSPNRTTTPAPPKPVSRSQNRSQNAEVTLPYKTSSEAIAWARLQFPGCPDETFERWMAEATPDARGRKAEAFYRRVIEELEAVVRKS